MVHIRVETNYNYTAIGDMWTGSPTIRSFVDWKILRWGRVWLGRARNVNQQLRLYQRRSHSLKRGSTSGFHVTDDDIPHAKYLFMDNTTEYSFMNYEEGLTGYLGMAWGLYDTYATSTLISTTLMAIPCSILPK